jgi:hypothetical protein
MDAELGFRLHAEPVWVIIGIEEVVTREDGTK